MQAIRKYIADRLSYKTRYNYSRNPNVKYQYSWFDKLYLQMMFNLVAERIEIEIDEGRKVPDFLWKRLEQINYRIQESKK